MKNSIVAILLIFLTFTSVFAQNRTPNTSQPNKKDEVFTKKSKFMIGADLQGQLDFGSQASYQNAYFVDFFPHLGYHLNDKIIVAGGPFVTAQRVLFGRDANDNKITDKSRFLGARVFGRAYFFKQIYFQAETEVFNFKAENSANQAADTSDYGIHIGFGYSRGRNISNSKSLYFNAGLFYNITQKRFNAYGNQSIPIDFVFIRGILPAGTFFRVGAGYKF